MPANRDKNQRFTFVYSNLYEIYKEGKKGKNPVEPVKPSSVGLTRAKTESSNVIKAKDVSQVQVIEEPKVEVKVKGYRAPELLGKRVEADQKRRIAQSLAKPTSNSSAVEGLKKNLNELSELHSRLKFMLTELEDLVKKS